MFNDADADSLARWQGKVEGRMDAFETSVRDLKVDLREIRSSTQANNQMLVSLVNGKKFNGHSDTVHAVSPARGVVTFQWLMEKFALPVLLAVNALILGLLMNHLIGG